MKKTNTFKRFAAITSASILAACMVAPMAMTSNAADLTMAAPTLPTGATIDTTVSAYKVFNLSKVENATGQYNVESWATGVKADKLIEAITANTTDFQVDGANVFASIEYDDSDPDASAKLVGAALAKLDPTQAEAFAKAVMNNLADAATTTGSYDSGKVTFTDIADGYYVMTCKAKSGDTDPYESLSLGMLTVVDGEVANPLIGNGTAKVGLPTVQKKVEENQEDNYATEAAKHETTDKSWNDVADYNIGDDVSFKLYGTMPSNLDKYDKYYYKFTDSLGSEFDKPTELIINIDNEGKENDINITATYSEGAWTTGATGVTVAYTANGFTVEFADIKNNQKADSTTLVTIEYDAVLNSSAVVGTPGQNNAVNLTYSNNPNNTGIGNTDTTPDDTVKVYTYAVKLNKDFFNAAGNELTPAEVTEGVYSTAKFSLSKGANKLWFVEYDGDGYDYVLAEEGDTGATQDLYLELVGEDLVIRIKGLDEGSYTLTEEAAPEGFNEAPAQTIEITAETVNDQTWDGTEEDVTLEEFSWKIGDDEVVQTGNDIDAIAKAVMENRKGTSLPSTGGIGTTLFYLGGGAMVAVAGVYLISKKRMKNAE